MKCPIVRGCCRSSGPTRRATTGRHARATTRAGQPGSGATGLVDRHASLPCPERPAVDHTARRRRRENTPANGAPRRGRSEACSRTSWSGSEQRRAPASSPRLHGPPLPLVVIGVVIGRRAPRLEPRSSYSPGSGPIPARSRAATPAFGTPRSTIAGTPVQQLRAQKFIPLVKPSLVKVIARVLKLAPLSSAAPLMPAGPAIMLSCTETYSRSPGCPSGRSC